MGFTPELALDASAGDGRPQRLMLISDHRVFYFGRLGNPGPRNFGCATLYVAEHEPLAIEQGQGWQSTYLAWVPPYTPHRIRSRERQLAVIMLEPEYTDTFALGRQLQPSRRHDCRDLALALRQGGDRLRHLPAAARLEDGALDALLFGRCLPANDPDPRIGRVVNHLCQHGDDGRSAACLAREEGLSQSRFLHLFKEQTGVCLRKYRAWRRARSLLYHVRSGATLTDIALETGYPDSTHFSHSIRRIYGFPPRDIVSGLRRLRIRVQVPVSCAGASPPTIASPHKSPAQAAAMV